MTQISSFQAKILYKIKKSVTLLLIQHEFETAMNDVNANYEKTDPNIIGPLLFNNYI